jgi:hypothetical protein
MTEGRLSTEAFVLRKKIDHLEKYMLTSEFTSLSYDDRHDLHEQHNLMISYHAVLQRRLNRLTTNA